MVCIHHKGINIGLGSQRCTRREVETPVILQGDTLNKLTHSLTLVKTSKESKHLSNTRPHTHTHKEQLAPWHDSMLVITMALFTA